ncbi:hypothetical protein [Shinella sp. BYT-45]|uniref:hypothetical protein n=1 Tax=Shinella sp. BYT-45 TaxID=3377377 RepID=UPI003980AA5D
MSRPAASKDQARLDAIRNRVALASPAWGLVADDRLTMTAGDGELVDVLTFADNVYIEDRDLILHAPEDLPWLLGMYDRVVTRLREAMAEIARLSPPPKKAKDYAAECAMQCGRQAFRVFLRERHGLETTDDERVNARVRSILQIQSRAELNTDENARKRWLSLRAGFNQWQEGR